MAYLMRQLILAILSVLLLMSIVFASDTGSITGIVVGDRGIPVAHAKVYVMERHHAYQGAMRYFNTDEQGLFRISNLPFGEYSVFAENEKEGYPDTGIAFYSNHVFPIAILSEGNPTAYVVVQLPPKAGVLKGSVTDAVTHKPVDPTLFFRRVADPKNFLAGGASSTYRILVPSDAPVTLEISAPGYIPWHYPGELHLKSNETVQLDIELRPAH